MVDLKKLEEKIIYALDLGVKFIFVNAGDATTGANRDTLQVQASIWNDTVFESKLDEVISNIKNSNYIALLKKNMNK